MNAVTQILKKEGERKRGEETDRVKNQGGDVTGDR
jgi:hypothetical protein